MLSLLRLRTLPLRCLPPRTSGTFPLRTPLRAISTTRPALIQRGLVCVNCRREGHIVKHCKEPCVACGVVGHRPRACPNPDPIRVKALKAAPHKCYRCGEQGHGLKKCPQPAKCFHCGQPVRLRLFILHILLLLLVRLLIRAFAEPRAERLPHGPAASRQGSRCPRQGQGRRLGSLPPRAADNSLFTMRSGLKSVRAMRSGLWLPRYLSNVGSKEVTDQGLNRTADFCIAVNVNLDAEQRRIRRG
ncbi:hypothetical protein C8R44DRAFT_342874 [Mycena epipterygia]|nr:hypothetical protein C8R44DRAFT_342874 [Mycena epipterygia]